MLGIIGALMLGGAIFFITYTLKRASETSQAEERIGADWSGDNVKARPPFYVMLTKPFLDGPYQELAAGFWKAAQIAQWKKRLTSAGLRRNITPEQFVAAKFWLAIEVAVPLLMIYLFSAEPIPIWFPLGFTAILFFLPNIHVHQLRQVRQLEIRLALPYVVDLLCLSMEAGLDFMGAIAKVVDRAPPSPLTEELSGVLKDIQLGKTRAEAMRSMADRVDMTEMSSFVATLVSSDAMGASIGNVLRAQADTMRSERLVKAEKLGAQASQKILVPLVFFILPSVLLMIFGPIILSMIGVK